MDSILRTENLTKRFDGLVAVDDVDLSVDRGELHAIIGPNGAGKTTFFNLLSGTLAPTQGTITFDGEDITGEEPYEIARRGLTRSFQISNLFPSISVFDNVRLGVQSVSQKRLSPTYVIRNRDRNEAVIEQTHEILSLIGLEDVADVPVEELPYGKKRTLEVGLTLSTDPDAILLDEPSSGLTTEETEELMEMIENIRRGLTIVLIEHDIDFVTAVSDRITVLHNGSILSQGDPETVQADDDVQEVYLRGA